MKTYKILNNNENLDEILLEITEDLEEGRKSISQMTLKEVKELIERMDEFTFFYRDIVKDIWH